MAITYRFEEYMPDRWTIECYDGAERVGGSDGWFSLYEDGVYAGLFVGPEDPALTAGQKAWFLHVFEGGPRPTREEVA